MAQQVHVVLTDDIDASSAAETVRFGLDGKQFEIDLSEKHARDLRAVLDTYIQRGRRVGGRRRTATRGNDIDPKAVRAWAKSSRIAVPARGRIPSEVIRKYKEAGH